MSEPWRPTRRAATAGALAAGLAACAPRAASPAPTQLRSRQFPADFLWGVATSAFQIEGALNEDGRGQSIWDVFPASKIADGSNAAVADGSYHRWAEDIALLKGLGAKAYRFSIAWPRALPEGAGAVNQKGLDYYARLIDGVIGANITPLATLFHWDLPLALQQAGGWAARDTTRRFADYAALIADKLGDRLKHFVILNEAAVHTIAGHVIGLHAPGLTDARLLGPVTHHQNLAQGLAIQALRARRSDLTIGTTMALQPSRAAGGALGFLDQLAADGFDAIWNGAYLDPLFKGQYPKTARAQIEPSILDGDMEITRQPIDFLGVNYYAPTYMRFDWASPAHISQAAPPANVEHDAFGRHIDPSGLSQVLTRLRADYGNPPVLITENGCSDPFSDGPALRDDAFRIAYLTHHLEAVKSAMEQGSRIGGYFHWTLVDNWEWAYGFRSKFGFVAQDRSTGARSVKQSYAWFNALAASGMLPA